MRRSPASVILALCAAMAACGGRSPAAPSQQLPFIVAARLEVRTVELESFSRNGLHWFSGKLQVTETTTQSSATIIGLRFATADPRWTASTFCYSPRMVPSGATVTIEVSTDCLDEEREQDLKGSTVDVTIFFTDDAQRTGEVRATALIR